MRGVTHIYDALHIMSRAKGKAVIRMRANVLYILRSVLECRGGGRVYCFQCRNFHEDANFFSVSAARSFNYHFYATMIHQSVLR